MTCFILMVLLGGGCARFHNPTGGIKYETVTEGIYRNTETAERKHEHALKKLNHGRVDEAERLVREALIADKTFGPAHNTLGQIYFDQGKYYLAAWEFDHATRQMPGRGEPFNNLGLVYEQAGQLDAAVDYYAMALELGEAPEFLGNYVRCRIRRGDRTSDLRELLDRMVLIDPREEWRDWASGQLVLGNIEKPLIFELGDGLDEEIPLEPEEQFPLQLPPARLPVESLPAPQPQGMDGGNSLPFSVDSVRQNR